MGTKAARRKYHLQVEEEEMIVVAVMMRNQIRESCDILKPVEESLCLKVTTCKNRLKIGKGL